VTKQEQLDWEAQWSRPAAFSAFLAGAFLLGNVLMFQAVLDDRPGVEGLPDFLLSVDERSGLFLGSGVVQALGGLLLVPVFLYLFRAAIARGAGMPSWFVYLVVVGPILYAISALLGTIDRIDLADQFASGEVIRGQEGDDRADDLVSEDPNVVVFGLSFAGSIAVAFLYVMVPLRSRRVGLLSPFMGILGVIAGALLVLQLVPLVPVVVQAFWLGAVGALYLGTWPGGRGPAWESGEAEPWPTPAQRRGLEPMPENEETKDKSLLDPSEPVEPEPVPERPSSRKRKKRR
jgi:hypothetical protein